MHGLENTEIQSDCIAPLTLST